MRRIYTQAGKRLAVRLCWLFGTLLYGASAGAAAAPDWEARALDGGSIGLAEFRGQVVLVDFWASWCVPCRASMRALGQLKSEFAGQAVRIVPISVDEEAEDARAFLARYGPELRSAHDPQGQIAQAYDLLGMPSSFVIDQRGELVLRHEGFRKGDENVWREEIRRLLSARP